MNEKLIKLISDKDKEFKKAFAELEEGILRIGLNDFIEHHNSLFVKNNILIQKRLAYNEQAFNEYLVQLDTLFKTRVNFLSHIHDQNTIEVLTEDCAKQEVEISRITTLLNMLS